MNGKPSRGRSVNRFTPLQPDRRHGWLDAPDAAGEERWLDVLTAGDDELVNLDRAIVYTSGAILAMFPGVVSAHLPTRIGQIISFAPKRLIHSRGNGKRFWRARFTAAAVCCERGLRLRAREFEGFLMLVHTLACEAHLWFAIPCLKSLQACSAETVRLVIHDDGSLSEESFAQFAAAFPDAVLVPRWQADEQLAEALSRFPAMSQARTHLPHVLKLFDTTMTHPEAIVCYADTDVLFQMRFRGLFPDAAQTGAGAFMMDSGNSFGAHPGDFWPFGPLRVARQLNSGLFWVRPDRIDYERMEYLFKRWGPARIKKYHGWFEQTVWADHAWRTRCSLYDPEQFGTASPDAARNRNLIGVHYVTPARKLLQAELEAAPSVRPNGPVEQVRVLPAKPFGVLGAARIAGQSLLGRNAAG